MRVVRLTFAPIQCSPNLVCNKKAKSKTVVENAKKALEKPEVVQTPVLEVAQTQTAEEKQEELLEQQDLSLDIVEEVLNEPPLERIETPSLPSLDEPDQTAPQNEIKK